MLVTALFALLCLPCAVAVVVCADELVARRIWTRGGRREINALRCLERDLSELDAELALPEPELRLDEIVADLRRLDRQRRSSPTCESATWLAAVLRAYDQRLVLASRSLGLVVHLDHLDGMDRDIERLRVEGLLQAAGVRLQAG